MTIKNRSVLLAGASLAVLFLILWRAGLPLHLRQAPPRGDSGSLLRERVLSQPRPSLRHVPLLTQAPAPAAHPTNTLENAAAPLSEEALEPLRRAFVPPRFAEDTHLPRERQTLLSNRLLLSPEKRFIPRSASGKQSPTTRHTTPFIVQFNGPVSDASRQLLTDAGALVRGYFPNNALLAELQPSALERLNQVSSVQSATEYLPSDKLQPFLSSLAAAYPPETRVRMTLQTLAPDDTGRVAVAVRAAGGEVTSTSAGTRWGTVRAILPLAALPALAAQGEVQWIEEYVRPVTFNDKAASGSHLNTTNVWNTWKLTGRGQIVGHADTGLDTGDLATLHPDFQNRIVALIARGRPGNASDTDGHGTHTAGSLFGSGAASAGQYRGMAYEAGIVHQSVLDSSGSLGGLDDIYGTFAESYAYGVRVHSDSWGSNTYGAYDSDCRTVDQFAWDHPDHLAVLASGNAGTDANHDGVIDTGAIGSPASAKNVISAGAAENDRPSGSGGYSSYTWYGAWGSKYSTSPLRSDYVSYSATTSPYRQGMAAFSSRGPTQDGRFKPDVVAPGTDVISTKSSVGSSQWGLLSANTRYCFDGGSSMATPLVAGTASLLRQYAVERGGVTNPSAALLKAMLLGGSRSLTPGQYGTGTTREIPASSPNNVEGWGQPDIANTVHPTNRMVRLYDRIAPASRATNTFTVAVTVSNTPLDVALAWIDYPATAGAALTLVNDFDLLVTAPDGTTLYPNAGISRDAVNTVETLRVAAAKTGSYQVRVIGYNVPYSGTAAALYVRGAIEAPPVIVHTPLAAQTNGLTPYSVNFLVQSLSALTNGEPRMLWCTGTAAAATGAWQTAAATWLGASAYHSEIPGQNAGTYVHYYLQAVTGTYDTRLPQAAPSSNWVFYVDYPVRFIVEGSPARFGTVTPAYGTNTLIANVPFSVSAPATVALSNGVRLACAGWIGTGSVPAQGTTNAASLVINQPSTLTWQWRYEYALTNRYRLADSDSVVSNSVEWHEAGSLASTETALDLGFVNNAPYALAGWFVDGARWPDASSASPNPATGILMSRPRLARADYLPLWLDTDGNGLSDWWEARYLGGTNSGVAASADLDGDGWTNLGEFLDNTDPRNAASHPTPPVIVVTPLDPLQSDRPPWTVSADITDNFNVAVANLIWRERGATVWTTNAMSWVQGNTFEGTINPPARGAKRVDYFVSAGDLIGYYDPSFCVTSPVYKVIGDYDTPWLGVSPETLGLVELASATTNVGLTVSNFAGPDLLWTARVAYASSPFSVTNAAWRHSGDNDVWCVTTNRTWNGDPVWYCGNPVTRHYPDACHALLDTPPFAVGTGGGLLFRQWIKTEYDSDIYYWDGAVVRISTDGGLTFTVIEPLSGYPYEITTNLESPFPSHQPCLAGDGTGWEPLMLDLSAYAGQTVIVRFEFGSDHYTNEEGWYLSHVTPFSLDRPSTAWLSPQGAWGGLLPDQWSAPVTLHLDPSALAFDEEAFACVRVESNDPTTAPLVPLTVRRGHTLSVAATGPGSAATDRTFLFRQDAATVTLQANPGGFIYAITVNGVPQPETYDFNTVSKTFNFSSVNEDIAVNVWFTYRTWTLSVSTPYGTATPSVGTHTFTHGTLINASVSTPLSANGGLTQYACTGWRIDGNEPLTGLTAQTAFAITNDAALTWLWQTNHWLNALAGSNGSVSPTGGWYRAGQSVCITALPSTYYHYSSWLGDTDGSTLYGTLLTLPMTRPRAVVALFDPNLTATHGVPEYWLAAHGWTHDFESAAEGDSDADGMPTWKEWLTDTDPTNKLSVLKLTGITVTNDAERLFWIGGVTRTQIVERAPSLVGPWQGVYTNRPPTPITNALLWTHPPGTGAFYRISVP